MMSDGTVPMENFHFTHNGNGDRFVGMFNGEVLLSAQGKTRDFYTSRADGRWYLNEGANAGDIERRCREVVDRMRSRAVVMREIADAADDDAMKERALALGKWAHASDNPGAMRLMAEGGCLSWGLVCDGSRDFDNRLDVIATPSQVMELRKDGIVMRDITPQDRITYSLGVEYRPDLEEPALVKDYFDTFIPDEKKRWLIFKALGSALLGGNPGRLLLILKGKSTTGKTQLVEALRAAYGTYAAVGNPSIFRGNLDDKPRPDVISVLKRRVIFLAEASKSWDLHGDRVKAITGGDGIKVRGMRSDDFLETVPHFTPVFYANEMPRVKGADQALKRRMLVMDFNQSPKVEDPTIKQAFLASLEVREYLLAMLVKGCIAAMNEGLEDVKDEFAAFTVEAFDQTTHLGEFMEWLQDSEQLQTLGAEELAVYGIKSKFVTVKAMHERYRAWVETHGNKQDKNDSLNYKEFNAQMKENYGWTTASINGANRWEGRVLKDLVWKPA